MVNDPIRKRISGDPADCGGGFDIILELEVGPNSSLQNQLVNWGLPLLYRLTVLFATVVFNLFIYLFIKEAEN
jgi:hypothetical protein